MYNSNKSFSSSLPSVTTQLYFVMARSISS